MNSRANIESGLEDWQILQQRGGTAEVRLSGSWVSSGAPGERVFVRVVEEDSGAAVIPWRAADCTGARRWSVRLGIPAGGLYRLETCLGAADTVSFLWTAAGDMVHHFGVGDLYVIAGQSNAAGYGRDPVCDPPELGVHLYRNSCRWDLASHPLSDSTRSAHEINSEGGNGGNSPYLSFAKYLKRELHHPIGLVQTALGGSPLSRWDPEEDGDLCRNMLDCIRRVGGRVRGILWYQGCSDTALPLAKTYLRRFRRMTEAVRTALGDGELPFLTVQLARLTGEAGPDAGLGWSLVREAQRQAAESIPGVSVVPSLDLTLSDLIHLSAASQLLLGERIARTALRRIYGRETGGLAPDLVRAVLEDDGAVTLRFAPVCESLYCYDVPADRLAFTIEDSLGAAAIASYRIPAADTICLRPARRLVGPSYVSHAFGADPAGRSPVDLAEHLPALAFCRVKIEAPGTP